MCWQLEKLLKEHDAKLAAADKEAVSKAIEKTREAAKTDDLDRIKSAVHELEQASHALSKTLYEKAGDSSAAARRWPPAASAPPTSRRSARRSTTPRQGASDGRVRRSPESTWRPTPWARVTIAQRHAGGAKSPSDRRRRSAGTFEAVRCESKPDGLDVRIMHV